MSRDSSENTEDNSQVELSSKEHDIPNLSDYPKNLETVSCQIVLLLFHPRLKWKHFCKTKSM